MAGSDGSGRTFDAVAQLESLPREELIRIIFCAWEFPVDEPGPEAR